MGITTLRVDIDDTVYNENLKYAFQSEVFDSGTINPDAPDTLAMVAGLQRLDLILNLKYIVISTSEMKYSSRWFYR